MRSKTHKDIRNYLGSSGIVTFIDTIRTVMIARLMSPYIVGLCTTLLVIPQMAQYLNLGAIESLTVMEPRYHTEKDRALLDNLKNTIFNYTLIVSLVSFAGVLIYLFFFPHKLDFVNRSAILAGSLIVFWEIKQYFTTRFIVEKEFFRLGMTDLFFTLFLTISQILLIPRMGIYGFWLPLIAANIIIIIYGIIFYLKKNHFSFFKIDYSILKKTLPLGTTLLLASTSYAPFAMLARIFIAGTAGVNEVGLFYLSIIVISKVSIIPSTIAKVMLPHMSGTQADQNTSKDLFELFFKSQIYSLAIGLVAIGLILFFIKPAVALILSKYMGGVASAKIMLIAAIPYILLDNANNVLLALQHKKIFMINLMKAILLQITLSILLYFTHQVTAANVSWSLFVVFAYYAFLSNYQVWLLKQKHLKALTS